MTHCVLRRLMKFDVKKYLNIPKWFYSIWYLTFICVTLRNRVNFTRVYTKNLRERESERERERERERGQGWCSAPYLQLPLFFPYNTHTKVLLSHALRSPEGAWGKSSLPPVTHVRACALSLVLQVQLSLLRSYELLFLRNVPYGFPGFPFFTFTNTPDFLSRVSPSLLLFQPLSHFSRIHHAEQQSF